MFSYKLDIKASKITYVVAQWETCLSADTTEKTERGKNP